MRIEKYVICMDKAIYVASMRTGTYEVTRKQLAVMYALRLCPASNVTSVMNYLKSKQCHISKPVLFEGIEKLIRHNLVSKDGRLYNLTPTGREYLSVIRNYLFNQRI